MDEILKKLDGISERISKIEDEIKEIKVSCDRMDNHISFIDVVYSKVKSPFERMLNMVNGKSIYLEDTPLPLKKIK